MGLTKGEKLFYISSTNDIIVLNEKIQWWDNFHLKRFAVYAKGKFKYKLSKIIMN